MASDRQIQANRANARRSTGPISKAGKDRSRLNSRKHGLTAKTLITIGECADGFDELRAELIEHHDPQSALESELVERLAGIFWRLRRAPFFEAAILDARHAQVSDDKNQEAELLNRSASNRWDQSAHWQPEQPDEQGRDEEEEKEEEEDEAAADLEASVHFGLALMKDATCGDALGRLARHETTLMNMLTKTLQQLDLLQSKRGNTKADPLTVVSLRSVA